MDLTRIKNIIVFTSGNAELRIQHEEWGVLEKLCERASGDGRGELRYKVPTWEDLQRLNCIRIEIIKL